MEIWSPPHDTTLGDRFQFGNGCEILCDIKIFSSVLCANNVIFVAKGDYITKKLGGSLWDSERGDSYKT